ncbi:MAG: type IV toxin-antitoxin system AbiEi family antitoxin domain-containing protein, partial [Solirubrobacterales bacterium]
LIGLAPGMRVRVVAERVRLASEAQEGVVGRGQLTACGLTGGEISRWLAQGRLIRILPGVYALGHTRLTWRGRLFAALLYAGAGSALSHGTAAYLWKLVECRNDEVHVCSPRPRRDIGWVVMHSRSGRSQSTERDEKLRTAGFIVLRFTWTHVTHEPGRVAAEIRAALAEQVLRHLAP